MPQPSPRPISDRAPVLPGPGPDHDLDRALERHMRGVWRYLCALGASVDEADDLTQEAFVVAWRKGVQDLEPSALGAYLRRTARFLFMRRVRDNQRARQRIADEVDRLWEVRCLEDEGDGMVEALRSCRESLGARARSALDLTYEAGRSRREIAAELGMSEDGIKTLLQRTRAALRECVRRWQAWNL